MEKTMTDLKELVKRHDYERKREQQLARDYWSRHYGRDQERTSRGGVTWL